MSEPPERSYLKRMSSLPKKPAGMPMEGSAVSMSSLGDRREKKARQAGWKMEWKASRRTGLGDGREVWNLKRAFASVAFEVSGFSKRSCFPVQSARIAHS